MKSLSPQTTAIYRLLLKSIPQSAQEIAQTLHILPTVVYRNVKYLIKLGLVKELATYPTRFAALPTADALENYTQTLTNNLTKNFFSNTSQEHASKAKKILSITFIKTRQELLELTTDDLRFAKSSIHHIVSGLEIPAETMLGYKQAHNRGIQLRFLVQNLNELNHDLLNNWQKMGLEIRYFPLLEARIIVFDSKIVYLTSYDPQNREEAIGIRFAQAPIAKQFQELFEYRWQNSEPILQEDNKAFRCFLF